MPGKIYFIIPDMYTEWIDDDEHYILCIEIEMEINVLNIYRNQCLKFHKRNHFTEFFSTYRFPVSRLLLYGKFYKKKLTMAWAVSALCNAIYWVNILLMKWCAVAVSDNGKSEDTLNFMMISVRKILHTMPKRIFHKFLYTYSSDWQECFRFQIQI